jgi:hypothetical protein
MVFLVSSIFSGCTEDTGIKVVQTVDAPLNTLVLPMSHFDGDYNITDEEQGTEGHPNEYGFWVVENYSVTYEASSLVQISQGLGRFNSSDDANAAMEAAISRAGAEPSIEEVDVENIGDASWVGRRTTTAEGTEITIYYVYFQVADVIAYLVMTDSILVESTVISYAHNFADNLQLAVIETG